MRNLFQKFKLFGVEYLLISGQASILYGAATFSEDIDIWVRPSRPNIQRLVNALANCRAKIYKLTPPLSLENFKFGHGFHFLIPARPIPLYLDVLGKPPRVGSFDKSLRRACTIETEWGTIPVVSIEDLISLKKTRRLSDYEVISNLVKIRASEESSPSISLLRWAASNTFNAEERAEYLKKLGKHCSIKKCRTIIAAQVSKLQTSDVSYWRKHISDLKRLRRLGRLMPEGMAVEELK